MQVSINIEAANDLEALNKRIYLEKIAKYFDLGNLKKISELAEKPGANERLPKLFNNPLFKAAL